MLRGECSVVADGCIVRRKVSIMCLNSSRASDKGIHLFKLFGEELKFQSYCWDFLKVKVDSIHHGFRANSSAIPPDSRELSAMRYFKKIKVKTVDLREK